MGIIIKQSIKGSVWSYLGVAVGFVTTAYLFPNYLSTDTIGLFSILLSYSILFAQFSSLGLHGVTNRLFTYFRNTDNAHNGYIFVAFLTMLVGIILFMVVFFLLRPQLIESNLEKSKLFADYIHLLIPLTFFTLVFMQLDLYNKVLYNAVFGTFLQEFIQRILIFGITILFAFKIFNLHQLIVSYAVVVCLKGVVMFVYLLLKGEINFRPQLNFIGKKLRKEMLSVAFFSILAGVGGSLVYNIDKILINQILGLGETGVYTIGFFFGTLVVIPSRPLLRISGTLIADAFKRDDLNYIADTYRRSCLNQFIIGTFLFGGIWINIDSIITILGPDYQSAKWVIFFISFAYLFDMLTGANTQIISYSKHYRVALYFILVLIVFVVVFMYLFLPVWGITGGAVAIALSIVFNNIMRFVFLKKKYNMQPFTSRILWVAAFFIVAYSAAVVLPEINLVPDILFRSTVFSVIFISLILLFKTSDDINKMFNKTIQLLKL